MSALASRHERLHRRRSTPGRVLEGCRKGRLIGKEVQYGGTSAVRLNEKTAEEQNAEKDDNRDDDDLDQTHG